MALGGGIWAVQNKILPGSYINFVSAARALGVLSERGIATMALEMDWGPDDTVMTVTAADFAQKSLTLLGFPYGHDKLKALRELFRNCRELLLFKLNRGGAKAANTWARAMYTGERGNALKVVIENAEHSTEESPLYVVSTLLDNVTVDRQTVATGDGLKANAFVEWLSGSVLALTAGTPLTGGTNGIADNEAYQRHLDLVEPYSFHAIGCASTAPEIKALYAAYTKRMREDVGAKFQCVLFRPNDVNYEGVIGVENGLVSDADSPAMVYWVTGAQAGCAVNASLTNRLYDGEYDVDLAGTQADLEAGIKAGKFMLHRVGAQARVLRDINTFTAFAEGKGEDFASNQVIRVLDQIGNDIAAIFNEKYLGLVPNDNAGRISLWNDIVKHHQTLLNLRALEGFDGDAVTVAPGENKRAVVVTDRVAVVSAMEQLYMTVVVA